MIDLNEVGPPLAPQPLYDLDAVVTELRATAHSWVPRLFPNGRLVQNEWRLANISGAPPRKSGSCVIALHGERAGDWHDFDGGEGGGPLSTIEHGTGLTGRELIAYAADLVGMKPGPPARKEPSTPAPARTQSDKASEIAFILSQTEPLDGSPAAAYLLCRGLALPSNSDLKAHPNLTYYETRTGYAALVAAVRDRTGSIVALHRTYLDADPKNSDQVTKASVPKPRMMLGKTAGGAVRLATLGDTGVLALSEGIETGLAVMTAMPKLSVWATLSTAGLEQVQLPPEAKRVLILADNDASGAGLRAADTAAQRFRIEGRDVAIAIPPTVGEDFNDLLLRAGPGAVCAVIEAAVPKDCMAAETSVIGQLRPVNFINPGSLPLFRSDEGDLSQAVRRVWDLLLSSNDSPWLFRFAGLPTWVVPDDDGRALAAPLTDQRLRHMLARLAFWHRLDRKGDVVPAHPPLALVKSVLATPDPALPVLVGIVNTPVFGRNGKLLTTSGYHPDARLLYIPQPNFALPPISERPTSQDREAARILICQDLLIDFPFVSPSEHAHAVALLLLGFVRSMVDGPTPLHLIEKPTPGTGATLMVDAIATILTGSGASVMTEGRDDEEWRKRVTAKLRQVPSMVLIDNLRHKLDSSAVAAALTAPYWEDRILGASEMARMPIRCVWIATGNNPEFSNEMARRIVRIRLDAHIERPWQRDGFRHPDLITWVRANRARIVSACLTLCQAWIAAGKPLGARTLGSYENWAQVMGGLLEVAGIDGFLENLDEMMQAADADGGEWRAFVTMWWNRFGTAEVGTAALFELALAADPPLSLGPGNERAQRTRLGKALARMRDRVFRLELLALRIQVCGTYQGAQRWKLSIAEETGPDERSRRSPTPVNLVNVVDVRELVSNDVHEADLNQINDLDGSREHRERRERFSILTREETQSENNKKGKTRSPPSRRSPDPMISIGSDGERGPTTFTDVHERSPSATQPEWLKDVP